MKVEQSNFGTFNNQEITLYTLSNSSGIEVKITNYGATITSLKVPNSKGDITNIACGFDTLEGYFSEEYKNNSPYFGCTVGRYCSQIKDAAFQLEGKKFQLAANCGDNNLHGGTVGFDKKVWSATAIEEKDAVGVTFSLESKDLEEGFPGNLTASVTFLLKETNELSIAYSATPDADTPLSMTNHTYFNLASFSETVENHNAKIFTDKRLVLDETGAATGEIVSVEGKADDLRNGKKIGEAHQEMGDGFEHFYIFDQVGELKQTASVSFGDRSIDVFTTEPCMLLYTGKYTSDALARENGEQYGKYKGFCCETHRYPNGPNIVNSPKSITKAGEEFKSKTIFKFGW
ncbi:aldose epimerase family protein [Ochrovirga pacifica]|uniref:aldose epimerase family protein n=1 Tax=Ochrovirga pacifica TaxID=1042376 RepID=UPI0002559D68|nr:aldose epimerase family protein [Ochrovirga pacifica]